MSVTTSNDMSISYGVVFLVMLQFNEYLIYTLNVLM